jgi:uncharacterized damage-inducible protein DinB
MTESERIVDQLNRAFEGEAWHGPAVLEILEGITAEQAAARPVHGAHSIWELVLHIGTWATACRRRLAGERAQPSDAEDWRAVTNTSEQSWQAARQELRQAHKELRDAIAKLDEARLDQPIIEGLSSTYVTLHGVIQHSLYHAGQIAILKKASLEQESL